MKSKSPLLKEQIDLNLFLSVHASMIDVRLVQLRCLLESEDDRYFVQSPWMALQQFSDFDHKGKLLPIVEL